jgi:hypothetical protein
VGAECSRVQTRKIVPGLVAGVRSHYRIKRGGGGRLAHCPAHSDLASTVQFSILYVYVNMSWRWFSEM